MKNKSGSGLIEWVALIALALIGLLVVTSCRSMGTDGVPSGLDREDLDKLIEILSDRIEEKVEQDPPVMPPEPGDGEEGQQDGQDGEDDFLKGVKWLRNDPNGLRARVTKELKAFDVESENRMTYRADSLADWSTLTHGNGKITSGVGCLFVKRDGKWTGGKFDHVYADGNWRDFKNVTGVHADYLPISPRSGEPVRFVLLNYEGTEASTWLEDTWP